MIRILLGATAALSYASLAFSDVIIVVTKADSTVAILDADTLELTARVEAGFNPHEAVGSPDGRRAFVSNYGNSRGQSISVIDVVEGEVIETWDLDGNRGPHGLQISADGQWLWVTTERTQTVTELNTATGQVNQTWPTGQRGSHQMAAAGDGAFLYVANVPDNTVTVFDRASGERRQIAVGASPEAIGASPDGRTAWVGNRGANTISVISSDAGEPVATFSSGGVMPFRLAFTPDGEEVWVTNVQSGNIAVFSADNYELLASVDMAQAPASVAFSADGRFAYVSHTFNGTLSVVDTASREILRTLAVGGEPDGVAYVDTD